MEGFLMEFVTFNAKCPLKIGDKIILDKDGSVKTITDIACVYYIKSKENLFMYEFDDSGQYVKIDIERTARGEDEQKE
jgi:hypothetical protein